MAARLARVATGVGACSLLVGLQASSARNESPAARDGSTAEKKNEKADGFSRRAGGSLPGLFTLGDFEVAAKRVLPKVIFGYYAGGADEEWSLRRNPAAFDELCFLPRLMEPCSSPDLTTRLFGLELSTPVVISPTGFADMACPDGQLEACRAASSRNALLILSHCSCTTMERIAAEGGDGPKFIQTFPWKDRDVVASFARRAEAFGYKGIVLTIDNNVRGKRVDDLRNGLQIPPRIKMSTVLDGLGHPSWTMRMLSDVLSGRFTAILYDKAGKGAPSDPAQLSQYMVSQINPTADWEELRYLRSIYKGPLLVKGVLHPEEAKRAVALDGLIVSNHGGRQLDGTPSALEALPAIVDAVGGRVPVLIDGGIRRGTDVVKAMACGAAGVGIGRPVLYGLAAGGEEGVTSVLDILTDEITRCLGMLGVARPADVAGAGVVVQRQSVAPRPVVARR